MKFTLRKHEIIRSKKEVQEVINSGKKFKGEYILFYVLVRKKEDNNSASSGNIPRKVVFLVGKKRIKKAVQRNKIKRYLRELFRLNKHRMLPYIQDGDVFHIAAIWKGNIVPEYKVLVTEMEKFLYWLKNLNQNNNKTE